MLDGTGGGVVTDDPFGVACAVSIAQAPRGFEVRQRVSDVVLGDKLPLACVATINPFQVFFDLG